MGTISNRKRLLAPIKKCTKNTGIKVDHPGRKTDYYPVIQAGKTDRLLLEKERVTLPVG